MSNASQWNDRSWNGYHFTQSNLPANHPYKDAPPYFD